VSVAAFIRELDLFARCGPETLAKLEAAVRPQQLEAGAPLFREGEPGTFLFMVRGGRLSVSKQTKKGREVVLRTMGSGEVGGLTSMTTDKTRSATLVAQEGAELLLLDKARFQELLAGRPDLSNSVIAHLAGKVRSKTRRLAQVAAGEEDDDKPRVAFFDAKRYDRTSFGEAGADELAFSFLEPRLSAATAPLAAGHEVVCAFVNDEVGGTVLRSLAEQGVGLVALRCAGTNNVDLTTAKELGIDVVRVPAYSPHAVAEHALALTMTLNRKVHRAHQRVREGNFSLAGLEGFELHGRVGGVVGTGKIGRCFAEILRGLGMEVLAYDLYPDAAFAEQLGVSYVELNKLLERSDVVSLHTPLTPDTHHMMNAEALGQMKPGAMLINTSRGGLVDTEALIQGLKSGQVGAAGLDVYEEESEYFFEDHSDHVITDDLLARLLAFNNVIVTSHQAFLTRDALANIAATTVENIQEWVSGRRGAELSNGVLAG